MAFKTINDLVQNLQALDYNKVKGILDKADVNFKDDPSWEDKVDFIREQLRDDLDIDEDITDISLKDNNLIGLQSFPEDEPKEKVLYKWENQPVAKDRYGNPIDKNNLDLYDDEDIYETDEHGFVTLPKRIKKGI